MKLDDKQKAESWGLLANGSSGRWDIAVDESRDGREWSMELIGPNIYLVFALRDLTVVSEAVSYLRDGTGPNRPSGSAEEDGLLLSRFGAVSVSLIWDNEDFLRCLIVVKTSDQSTLLHLGLEAADIQMFGDALSQVAEDLQPSGEESNGTE